MNWFITILLMFGSAIFGLFVAALCFVSKDSDSRIKKIREIPEIREEIVQAAIDHAYVERCRAENDYDINIDGKGEGEIQKILERWT